MDKKSRDNRANQLNPNNSAYWKSRMGNTKKSGSSLGKRSVGSSGGYSGGYSDSSSEDNTPVRFVKKPKKSLFGRIKGNYGWVVCNHMGEFLQSADVIIFWTDLFRKAILFKSPEEAEAYLNNYPKVKSSYYRIRCVDLGD